MPAFDLRRAAVGDRVEHEFMVRDRADKTTKTGKPFATLTLGNATGTIETAPIWEERLDWVAGAERGKVIQVIGEVSTFGEEHARRRQLQLSAPARVLPVAEFDPAQFLPTVDIPADRLWDALDKLRTGITTPSIRRAVDLIFADDPFREQFERAPGAPKGHHAQIGGLLLHTCEVATIAKEIARTVRHANKDLCVAGALLHDIGKVEAYSVGPDGFATTVPGRLIGHVVLGALQFDRAAAAAGQALTAVQRDEILHLILSHHGVLEHGSPVQPLTTEAEIVHWADEASAKATDMIEEFEDPELFPPGSTAELSAKKSWRLGRFLWRRPTAWD